MIRRSLRENLLIASLTSQTRRAIERDLEDMTIQPPQVIHADNSQAQVVFPRSCVVSVVSRTNDGQSVGNAVIGYEGVFALSADAPNLSGVVQIGGAASVMTREAFEKHLDNREFRDTITTYNQNLLSFCCQSALCQAFHTAEQRLSRWLLSMHDRSEQDELLLTQEFLASVLGVHRPTVTIAARILQAAGMIQYRYGRVTIVDREALEEAACECYRLVCRPDDSE